MNEDIGNYAPPSDELLEVLGMRLIDIQNKLMVQMEVKGVKSDWIGFSAINGFNNKTYELRVCMRELE
ncbi:MAG: hypothetical protein IKF79_01600 [Methanosphaera sp.]|nr:hypothetical protein [Methanosphaera sp.]